LAALNKAISQHQNDFEEGIISIVDDSHGVASFGKSGRGCEDYCNAKADLLIGTLGKGFGVDGGYVTGDGIFIDYLRESAATYIYSNPIGAGTAAAALEAIKILDSPEGKNLIMRLNENISHFKEGMKKAGFIFAADSKHAIQPVLIADPVKTRALTDELFKEGIIVTNISYPIVPKGKDEIRVQISAAHTKKDLDECIEKFTKAAKKLAILGN
jgi:glycine C-acetyltransferase